MHDGMHIRALTASDAEAYLALRREMLLDSPWAFSASPADDRFQTARDVADHLSDRGRAIIGGFGDGPDGTTPARLLGAAGLSMNPRAKMHHRAQVWGVYVTPDARGKGVGRAILQRLKQLASTWPGVTSLALSASQSSPGAIAMYTRVGFRAWGVEPGAMVVDGRQFDEVHMVASLGSDPA